MALFLCCPRGLQLGLCKVMVVVLTLMLPLICILFVFFPSLCKYFISVPMCIILNIILLYLYVGPGGPKWKKGVYCHKGQFGSLIFNFNFITLSNIYHLITLLNTYCCVINIFYYSVKQLSFCYKYLCLNKPSQ